MKAPEIKLKHSLQRLTRAIAIDNSDIYTAYFYDGVSLHISKDSAERRASHSIPIKFIDRSKIV